MLMVDLLATGATAMHNALALLASPQTRITHTGPARRGGPEDANVLALAIE